MFPLGLYHILCDLQKDFLKAGFVPGSPCEWCTAEKGALSKHNFYTLPFLTHQSVIASNQSPLLAVLVSKAGILSVRSKTLSGSHALVLLSAGAAPTPQANIPFCQHPAWAQCHSFSPWCSSQTSSTTWLQEQVLHGGQDSPLGREAEAHKLISLHHLLVRKKNTQNDTGENVIDLSTILLSYSYYGQSYLATLWTVIFWSNWNCSALPFK